MSDDRYKYITKLKKNRKYDEKTEVNSSKKVNNKTKKQSFNIQGRMDKVWKILQTPYKEIIQLTAIMTANPYNTNLEKVLILINILK